MDSTAKVKPPIVELCDVNRCDIEAVEDVAINVDEHDFGLKSKYDNTNTSSKKKVKPVCSVLY